MAYHRRIRPSWTLTTCMICTDTKTPADMFRSSACPHSFCTTCISHHIRAKIEYNIADVKCPEPGCQAALDPSTCASFVPKGTMDRWGDALCEAAIVGTRRLYCPFVDCLVMMLLEDEGKGDDEVVRAAECMGCRRMFCAQCKVGWHGDISCEEFQRARGENDLMVMNELAKKNKWKRCPHCQIYVSRISGCDSIRCKCGYYFCYSCGAKSGGLDHHFCPHNEISFLSLLWNGFM